MAFTEEAISAWQQFIQQKAMHISYLTGRAVQNRFLQMEQLNLDSADTKTGAPASIQVNGGAKESLDHYAVTGIKYVPVQVKAEDYADFAAKYPVVKNGETLVGGFSENNLKAYSETANVTVNTNGLKTVTKNEDENLQFQCKKNRNRIRYSGN